MCVCVLFIFALCVGVGVCVCICAGVCVCWCVCLCVNADVHCRAASGSVKLSDQRTLTGFEDFALFSVCICVLASECYYCNGVLSWGLRLPFLQHLRVLSFS